MRSVNLYYQFQGKPNMLVTIITPSFNQGNFLEETINSIKRQKYRPIEHIIIDGGSKDETVKILKEYSLNSEGIDVKWTSEPDHGHPHAVNKGYERAKGEIIGWINSDDVYFDRNVVSCVVDEFKKRPNIDIIHGDVALISVDSRIGLFWCLPSFDSTRMLIGNRLSQPTAFFRQHVIEKCKLDENFLLSLDYEYWLRLGQYFQFRHIGKILAGDRDHPMRASHVKNKLLLESHNKAKNMYWRDPTLKYYLYRATDGPMRLYYRIKGLYLLISFLNNSEWRNSIAFNGGIDSYKKLILRQLFFRIGRSF